MKDKPPTKLSLHAVRMVNLAQILLLPAHLIYLKQMIKLRVWVPTRQSWAGPRRSEVGLRISGLDLGVQHPRLRLVHLVKDGGHLI